MLISCESRPTKNCFLRRMQRRSHNSRQFWRFNKWACDFNSAPSFCDHCHCT